MVPDGAARLVLPASLRELDLSGNGIADDGAARLKLPTSLAHLNLARNNIGNRGAACLDLPPCLHHVDLYSNWDLDSALLTSIKRLREVNLTRLYLAFLISMRQTSGVSTAAFAPLALKYWGIDTRYCCRTTMQRTVSLGEKMDNLDAERRSLENAVIEAASAL